MLRYGWATSGGEGSVKAMAALQWGRGVSWPVATMRLAIGGFQYTAVVGGLEARTYELRVILEYPRTGWSTRTVLEREIAVR